MDKKKCFTYIILGLGLLLTLVGIVILCQCGSDHLGSNNSGVIRASTSVEFGADFYTHSAQYTGLAANTLIDTYKLLSIAIGIFFIVVGLTEVSVTLLLTKEDLPFMRKFY